jgi:hypothetical protein
MSATALAMVATAVCWVRRGDGLGAGRAPAADRGAGSGPYNPPGEPPEGSAGREIREEYGNCLQREVRLTAQQVLTGHLVPGDGSGGRFWPDLDLDLGGAILMDLKLHDCGLRNAGFARARFSGRQPLRRRRLPRRRPFSRGDLLRLACRSGVRQLLRDFPRPRATSIPAPCSTESGWSVGSVRV